MGLSLWWCASSLAWEVVVSPGNHILIEWPESMAGPEMVGTFCHEPGRLTILEPNFLSESRNCERGWNSAGEEITYRFRRRSLA